MSAYSFFFFLIDDSFKKSHNAQGGQSRVNVPAVNSSDSTNNASAHRNVQNGAHLQPQLHGVCTHLLVFFLLLFCCWFSVFDFLFTLKIGSCVEKNVNGILNLCLF